ncbi:MAG: hypothetical protein UU73_C0001G0004 [Candidatus Daviesbacteria bacterium GW2011_GWA1_41_61]|uniref:Uncharacterized protein n=1 Tax=Candidatus Daviesbacteria bacterium GW2011_GWA2_40_9 TaxID=1618424 RepID=A0A0G0WF38_9BACT|nr:MAG: hypothetical protein UU29_C0008G0004 [Candidatus Daviesbacteria bacterium GW2011_GWA2_40_9]KKR92823.1 MAG: hypothetical protein UU44_C0004G0005 [Candidatus Daviesbacteria bacterium GW2011_GWB1_41_15]KKS15367.1 MAG: hypothetical protein UU73_C0001G0004 [Candidatus Daviesbacteria bacterium GW2011_GWA1_41_61]
MEAQQLSGQEDIKPGREEISLMLFSWLENRKIYIRI